MRLSLRRVFSFVVSSPLEEMALENLQESKKTLEHAFAADVELQMENEAVPV